MIRGKASGWMWPVDENGEAIGAPIELMDVDVSNVVIVPTYAPTIPCPGEEGHPYLELMRDSDGTGWVDCVTCFKRILQVEPGREREALNLASDRHQSCRP